MVISGGLFVAGGVAVLWVDFKGGVTTIALFGFGLAFSIKNLRRKLPNAEISPGDVKVIGGVRIGPSRRSTALLGCALVSLGLVLLVFRPRSFPMWTQGAYWLISIAGGGILTGCALRLLPASYLIFEPAGLVVGQFGWSALCPWDAIAAVEETEVADHPAMLISLASPAQCRVRPAQRARFERGIAQARRVVGADLVLVISNFGVDAPVLVAAIRRYHKDPAARAELVHGHANRLENWETR
jgi:hypothetical protein